MYDRSTRRISAPGWPLAGLLCGLLAGSAAHANPIDPTVLHGSAQFAPSGANTLNVTTSPNTIINWQGFSIDTGERTNFFQPSASSAVLNRVTGADPSSILGQLWSDGRVFLVNPHGIVFGEGAVVDTAGLVASTLGISNTDFLAGHYRFDGGPDAGGIVNRGLIEAGADGVFLLAPRIENSGVIRTDGGDLVLAAGRTITLTSLDLDGVRVEVQAPEDEVLNLGDLIAKHGAAGVFAGSIRNSGTVEANAVTVDDDGTIRLVAQGDITLEAGGRVAAEGPSGGEVHVKSKSGTTWVSGEVSARASEGRGGTIRLLGRRVGLVGARVDASGPGGGGEVLVGGDVSGEGPVPTAESTYVSSDSAVSADALDYGDGGKVVVFASDFANVQGRLSARGGAQGGDGGFVETSGLKSFVITHTPDITAPNGDGGHWLIDPYDIEIVAGNGNTDINNADPFESTGDSAQLGIGLIIAALTGDQSVTVQTGGGGANEDGDITLNTAFDVESTTGTNTLTLDAHGYIFIRETISDTSGGDVLNLVLDAGEDVGLLADVTLFDGSLRTEGEWVGVANGATVTLDGVTWDMNNDGLSIGSDTGDLRTDNGTVVVRNGATIDAEDKWLAVGDESGTEGTLRIESGANVTARAVVIGLDAGSQGTVTVTGSGSSLTTVGTDNRVVVGDKGTGTLHVLDGGLVDTLRFNVAESGVGRVVIRGVAADGTRSRVIVSPANGKGSGNSVDEAGYARVGRNAGSDGRLEIRDGGLLRVLDGDGTQGPGFTLARNKGSVGTLLIDGDGSSLEVIQNAPVTEHPLGSNVISSGPYAFLGRRGGGTTTIRNGGTLLVRGENAYVGVSRDSVNPAFPDSDTGPINQRSVVRIESGGRMEIDGDDGEYALLVIGDGGPNADGMVTVTGSGSALVTKGNDNRIRVGDEGTGKLHVLDGGLVDTLRFNVAESGVGRVVIRGVAADGTRSRVIVSPANGKGSGNSVDEAGYARVGRNAGSDGRLEIRDGGLLRVLDGDGTQGPGFTLARNKGSVGTLLIDGDGSSLEVIQNAPVTEHPLGSNVISSGPYAFLGRRGGGTTTIRNGGTLLVRGENAYVGVSRDSVNPAFPDSDTGPINQRSVVRIESGGRMEIDGDDGEYALLVIGDGGPNADGMVTVTGSGSALVTKGNDNRIRVGDEGTGKLHVLDGGLVDTLFLEVGRRSVGRAVIRGVAADGTRSRVIVSPANGKFPGVIASEGGFVRVGHIAGSNGSLEILDGGLLRVLDGDGTHGPAFQLARYKDSVGTLLIDGDGSSLEVIQNARAVHGNPDVPPGPLVQLGRRGGGTTTIRNGGRLLVRGEHAYVQVSRDSIWERYPDPDPGPIHQQSVVRIESGGRMDIDGAGARMVIGDSGPAADGVVTVTGSGSALVTKGTDNQVVVGDEGTGTLHVLDGGLVDTLYLDVARSGVGRAVIRGVAADGTRSRVIVSPANGKFSGVFASEGGFARAGRNAGSNGSLEILDGGLLRVLDGDGTHGPEFQLARNKGSVGTLLIDGEGSSLEVIQNARAVHGNPDVAPGPLVQLGRRGGGTTTIRNGGRLLVRGEHAYVRISRDSVNLAFPDSDTGPINQRSVVRIESGGRMEIDGEDGDYAILALGDGGPNANGMVTVTGSGSSLTTKGANNRIIVGDEGNGTLHVLDGGLVETLWLEVARSGVGRTVIRGVAADGARSRVIVSPAHGKFTGGYADEAGFAGVARNAGSRGTLEILEGGLLRVLDGNGTHGPDFRVARNKGSVGTLLIDGEGSSLEVIQNGPAVHGNRYVWAGPSAQLGRRGGATTTIRNGGKLLVRGESAFVRVSRDSLYSISPDPDPGPIHQQSVVRIESGGRMDIDGAGARMVIGDSGPAADGVVTVTGPGSAIVLTGAGNRLVVGDEGRGRLDVRDGGIALYGELVVGAMGTTNVSTAQEVEEEVDAIVDDVLPERQGRAEDDGGAETGDEESREGEDDEEEDESEETAGVDEAGEEEQEELQMCPA